jgi:hypothetical protein
MLDTVDIMGLGNVLTLYATIDDALQETDSEKKKAVEAVRGRF